MLPTLDYVLFCGEGLTEFISNKLCAFYNKEISRHPARVIFSMPSEMRAALIDRYKETFDETILYRYDPTDVTFWRCRNLIRIMYYTQSMGTHIVIDHGHVFRHLSEDVSDIDVGYVVSPNVTSQLVQKVSQNLIKHFPDLNYEDIQPVDFSALYLSEQLKSQVRVILEHVISDYPNYVQRTEAYAILSVILHSIDPDLKSAPISVEPGINISESPLVKDFYSLL